LSGSSRSSTHEPVTVAIVGCGAIAESFYLPAILKNEYVSKNVVLVDSDEARLTLISRKFDLPNYRTNYHELLGKVNGAIIAVPHHLHHRMSMDFLKYGSHVLCEKPLAETSKQAKEMVDESKASHVTISVNNTRRLYPAYGKIRELIQSGAIGSLTSISFTNGYLFQWPTASGFYFNSAEGRPKGVLLDQGAHVLDLICWWTGRKPRVVRAENDSFGGSEGMAILTLNQGGCTIDVKLSWLSQLQNKYVIIGEQGSIEGPIEDIKSFNLKYRGGKSKRVKVKCQEKRYVDFADRLVANFVKVLRNEAEPLVPGADVIPSIELIEECYEASNRLSMPWYDDLEALNAR
jgi:predicted dehydrogenase